VGCFSLKAKNTEPQKVALRPAAGKCDSFYGFFWVVLSRDHAGFLGMFAKL
jgi:hypothetical protein